MKEIAQIKKESLSKEKTKKSLSAPEYLAV